MKKLNIYYNIAENSGVGYYREYLPAIALRELGLANVLINDFTWGQNRLICKQFGYECDMVVSGNEGAVITDTFIEHLKTAHGKETPDAEKRLIDQKVVSMVEPSIETLNKIGWWADIIIFGRRDTSDYLSQWKGISEFFNIPVVLDTDDNVHATRPTNPGYRGYYPGSEAIYWNKEGSKRVDAITVSTENLKHVHEKENKNIYVLPNCLEFPRWTSAKPKHKEVRIGLLLSSAHHEDASLLKKVIPKILKKYPQAHLYYTSIFGYIFEEIQKECSDQMHPIPWIPLKEWPESVVNYGFDIGLAPLVDNMFNRAKSNLRYMEYSAARMATIASPVEPYKCIIQRKTGLLASTEQQWENYLETLIEDVPYRRALAKNAYNYVAKNFDIYKKVPLWVKTYEKVIKDYKKAHGSKKYPTQDKLFNKVSAVNTLA